MLINGLQPTSKSSQAVLDDFQNISSTTYGEIATFLENDFAREGQELQVLGLPPSDYTDSPPFLDNIVNSRVKSFAQVVHKIWPQLVRATNVSALRLCDQCERTFLPLNHNFVIPGSCFDYQYTLTKTKLTTIISWNIQRTILLGQFLDCRRPLIFQFDLARERYASKLYG